VSEQPDLPPSFNTGPYHRPAPRDQEKAETKRLGFIVLGIVGLLVAGVLARSFMTARAPDTTLHDTSGTPVIAASNAPVKAAPINPGGLQVPGADQDVLAGSSGSGAANGQLAPGPETPAPDQLAAGNVAPPPPVVHAPVLHAPPASTAPLQRLAEAAPLPPKHHHSVAKQQAAVADNPPAPAATGGQAVQLGALISRDDAMKEWRRDKNRQPELFAGHDPHIVTVSVNGHTMYRLRTDGFSDRDEALKFCAKVRDRHGKCELR